MSNNATSDETAKKRTAYHDQANERADKLVSKWNRFCFAELPEWEDRYSGLLGLPDKRAAESPDSDALCVIYSIYETRMCSYQGRIALIRNVDNPKLIFTSKNPTYVSLQEPVFSNDGRFVFIRIYTNDFMGLLIVDVYDSRYTCIKFPAFDSWETVFEGNEKVRLLNQSQTTDVALELHSLHWHEIEAAVVDYVPAFELYW